jgi:hypothetical protein
VSELTQVREIVARSLSWEEAHASFESAVANLAPELRGKRPGVFPHSCWDLLTVQAELADFMERADYHQYKWPDEVWPTSPEPSSDSAWEESISAVLRDRDHLKEIAMRSSIDLTAKIPWGTGQTYLRTLLVAVDHTSYHVGQILVVRKFLGVWP